MWLRAGSPGILVVGTGSRAMRHFTCQELVQITSPAGKIHCNLVRLQVIALWKGQLFFGKERKERCNQLSVQHFLSPNSLGAPPLSGVGERALSQACLFSAARFLGTLLGEKKTRKDDNNNWEGFPISQSMRTMPAGENW